MYEVMEYTIMSDVYDEYIEMHPAMEAFGKKKKGKNIFQRIWQKILEIIRAIKEKIAKLFNKKKKAPPQIIQKLRRIPLFQAIVKNKKKAIGVAAIAAASITAVVAGMSIWKKTGKKPADMDTRISRASTQVAALAGSNQDSTAVSNQSNQDSTAIVVVALNEELSTTPESRYLSENVETMEQAAQRVYQIEGPTADDELNEFADQLYNETKQKILDLMNEFNGKLAEIDDFYDKKIKEVKYNGMVNTDDETRYGMINEINKQRQSAKNDLELKYSRRAEDIQSDYYDRVRLKKGDLGLNY